jgi:hypothetical protein
MKLSDMAHSVTDALKRMTGRLTGRKEAHGSQSSSSNRSNTKK